MSPYMYPLRDYLGYLIPSFPSNQQEEERALPSFSERPTVSGLRRVPGFGFIGFN